MAASKKADSREMQLSDRISYINRKLQKTGLVVGLTMLIASLAFLVIAVYMGYNVFENFANDSVNDITLHRINQLVSSVLLMMVTTLTSRIFFRLYRGESPFVYRNILAIRVDAVMLTLLSVLPIAVQILAGFLLGMDVAFSMNIIYVLIAAVFYCTSYILEQGDILQKKSDRMLKIQESIIFQYAEVSEHKSGQPSHHAKRMSEYSRVLAKNMGMSDQEAETISLAAIMHDIGNLLIPREILMRESSLSDEEFAIMKTHVVAGDELLREATGDVMQTARKMALEHHENWDGTGYLGKKGDEIDLGAQIIAIAHMFDMLVRAKSYKKGWEMNRLYSTMLDESGKKFGPDVMASFMKSYKEMMEIYDRYNKSNTSDYVVAQDIIENYDKILGEYSPRLKSVEVEERPENPYQNVELDLRRLI